MGSRPVATSTRPRAFRTPPTRQRRPPPPSFLPPGNYTTSKLTLKSGTQIQGVPGASVLRYAGGGAIIAIEKAADIRLTGLTLAGGAKPIDGGGLLIAESVKGLTVSDCRIVGSAEDGVVLRKVSDRVSDLRNRRYPQRWTVQRGRCRP